MTKQKALLGYVFGYKEKTDEGNNTVKVSFISGISKKYPSQHAQKKDFYADEIRTGDVSEIFINPELAYEAFKHEIAQNMPKTWDRPQSEMSFYEELFSERAARFSHPVNVEQFIALTSFSMIGLHFMKPYESTEVRNELLRKFVGPYFEGSFISVVDAFNDHQRISAEIYEEEVEASLGSLKM